MMHTESLLAPPKDIPAECIIGHDRGGVWGTRRPNAHMYHFRFSGSTGSPSPRETHRVSFHRGLTSPVLASFLSDTFGHFGVGVRPKHPPESGL